MFLICREKGTCARALSRFMSGMHEIPCGAVQHVKLKEALRVFVWVICGRSWRSRAAAASWSEPSDVGSLRPEVHTLAAG